MMKIAKKQVQITLVVIIVLAAFVLLFPGAFGWCIRSHELRQVNRVLDSNPDQILLACRDMLTRREQFEPMVNHRFGDYASVRGDSLGDAPVPPIISGLHPRDITFSSNSVSVDVTNPFNPFGFTGFAEGVSGTGQVKVMDGLWLFHDGQLSGEKANQALQRIAAGRGKR